MKLHKKLVMFQLLLATFFVMSCENDTSGNLTGPVYKISMSGSTKLDPANDKVTTDLLGWYDEDSNVFTFTLKWSNLWLVTGTKKLTKIKFYSSESSENTLRELNINNSNVTGSQVLAISGNNAILPEMKKAFLEGKWNFVLLTTDNPNGVISGQLSANKQDENDEVIIYVQNIKLDSSNNYILTTGNTSTLKVQLIQPLYATNKELKWESSTPNVATVDQKGNVTGVSKGSSTITVSATDGSNVSTQSLVTVN